VWRVSVLVALAWVSCGVGPTGVTAVCDVEALRCDVICAFPDLTQHCNRCIRRRPMRFGKREDSLTYKPMRFGKREDPMTYKPMRFGKREDPMTYKPMRFGKRSDTSDAVPDLPANKPMRFGKRGSGREASQEEAFQIPVYRKPGLPKSTKMNPNNGNFDSQRGIDSLLLNTLGEMLSNNEYDNEVPAIRPQDAWGTQPDSLKSSTASRSSNLHGYVYPPAAIHSRQRRSDDVVREMVSSLMDLLGLEELPVDPKEYGCHELMNSFLF
ncbi:unnamed protein product, partial [Meganyctiphanes norvegica]